MKDVVKAKGTFHLKVYRHGIFWKEILRKNLVVNIGRNNIAEQVATNAGKYVDQISFGTNGANETVSDSAITAPFTKLIGGSSFPGTGQVQFNFSLATGESNGVTIAEFGLLSHDNTLFARVANLSTNAPFAAIVKTSAISFDGTWTIEF